MSSPKDKGNISPPEGPKITKGGQTGAILAKLDTRTNTPEAQPDIQKPKVPPEVVKLSEEEAKKKAEARKISVGERSDAKRDMIAEEVALNEEIKRLEPIMIIVLSKVFHQGIKKEDVASLIAFSKIKIDTTNFSDLEKTALEKLYDIDTPLAKKIAVKWKNWVENSYNEYKTADEIVKTKLSPKTPEKSSSVTEKTWEWIKQNPIPTIVTIAAVGLGAYFIFSDSDESGTEKEKSWFSKKRIFGTLLALGGILGFLGFDKIKEFCKKIADFSEEKWDKFITHIKAGNYLLAIKSIFEGSDNHYQYYKQIAEKISQEEGKPISANTIQAIANAKCGDFTSKTSEGLSYALSKAKEVPYLGAAIAAVGGKDKKQMEEEAILRTYLQKHANKIPKGEKTTVFEALTAITNISPLSSASPEKQKPMITDAVDTGNGEAIGVNHEIATNILEKFKNKPHLKIFFEKHAKNWNEAILKSHNFWKELLEACHLDQVGLVLADNKVVLVDGDNVFCITDSPALYKTAQDVINAGAASDEVGWSSSVKNIVVAGLEACVVVGAGFGGVKNLFTSGENIIWRTIKGGFKGGFSGLLFPLKAVNPYNLQGIYRGTKGAEFSIRRTFASGAAKIEILRNEAKYYAEIGQKYRNLNAPGRSWSPKTLYAKANKGRFRKLEDRFVEKFAVAYNELQKAQNIANPEKLLFDSDIAKDKTKDTMASFLRDQHAHELVSLENLGKSLAEPLETAKFEKLPDTITKIKALGEVSDKAERYMEDTIAKTREMQKAGRSVTEIEKFQREAESNLQKIRENYNNSFTHLKSLEKDMAPAEKKALQELIETKLTKASGVRGIWKEIKGRGKFALVFGIAHVVWDVYKVTKEEKEQHIQRKLLSIVNEIGLDTLQLVLDILSPFGISDWYTVVSGKEFLTGKKAGIWNRVTRAVFGTYNLAADTLAAIGGAATIEVGGAGGAGIYAAGNALETGIRAAGKGPKIYRAAKAVLPEIATLAKDAGGYKKLLEIVKSKNTIQMLQTTKKVSGIASTGLLGLELTKAAYAGYHIVFDTKDQPEHVLEAN